MGREFDLNVVLELSYKVTLGTATVKMDRLSNRYCEGGSKTWNGYCDFNKGVIQHLKDPKTGDEYFEVKLNEPVRLILNRVKLHLLHWHCYCNMVGKVNCGYLWNLIRKTYVSYWSRFKREVLNVIMEWENVSMGQFVFASPKRVQRTRDKKTGENLVLLS